MKRAIGALSLGLALGCSGQPQPRLAAAPGAGASSAPAASPAEPPSEANAQPVVDAALAHVGEIRKLAPLGPVKSAVIGREELLRRMKDELFKDLEPELIEGTTELLFALGATGAELDYLGSILTLLGSQLAGFYDPTQKEMVLLDDLGVEAQQATLWHELVHALQDQHYDLKKLVKWAPDRGDALTAVQCLAEGDATSAMLDTMLLPRGQDALSVPESSLGNMLAMVEALPEIAAVPPILKRSVVAPYVDGLIFTHSLRREGGWAAVDAAWKSLPASTEQVLHPEKYRAREPPERMPMPPPAPGGPDRVLFHDVLGEQVLRLAFEEWVPHGTAVDSAAGWGGDQAAVFVAADRRAVAVRLRFDDEKEAIAAQETLARGALTPELEARQGDRPGSYVTREAALQAIRNNGVCVERQRRGPFAVVRVGRDLGVALGPYLRRTGVASSDSTCATGLRWADSIARAR